MVQPLHYRNHYHVCIGVEVSPCQTQAELMIARLASAILLSLSATALTAVTAYSHSGGLDGYGWHHDRKNGGYHCHQGSFAGQSFASKNEMLAALETHTQGPNDLRHRVQFPRRSGMSSNANTTFQASL